MHTTAAVTLSLILASANVLPAPAQTPANLRSRSNFLLPRELPEAAQHQRLAEFVSTRFPLVVRTGRFDSDGWPTSTCVYARRSSARVTAYEQPGRAQHCPMIATYVDGVRITDVGAYLNSVALQDIESIEIVAAADAMLRYGLGANGGEVMVMWTKGRGPHAKPKL
jgi:hypothetical protein